MIWLLTFVVSFALGAAVFKFAISLLSPENHLNTFPRALITSAIVAAVSVSGAVALGPLGSLIAFVINVVIIKQGYQMAVWRVLLVVFFNALISGLLSGFLADVMR
jgi:hypothetical protein